MALGLHLLLCGYISTWTATMAASPPCRKSAELHNIQWPQGREQLVAFGGKGFEWGGSFFGLKKKVRFFGDTWAFDLAHQKWRKLARAAGERTPRPRWKPSSTAFGNNSGMILFGGCKSTEAYGVMNDLWVLTPKANGGATWTEVITSQPPAKRRGHIAVATSTHLFVMGGKSWIQGHGTNILVDVWSIPLSVIQSSLHGKAKDMDLAAVAMEASGMPSQWRRRADFPAPARWGTTGEIISGPDGREYIACFGGRNYAPPGYGSKYIYYGQLWLYDIQADNWTLEHPGGREAPMARDHHGATSLNGDLWIFGGRIVDKKVYDAVLNDLWTYSLATRSWRLVDAGLGRAPSPRFMPGVSEATWRGERAIAIFGGETFPGTTKLSSLNDVWVYTPGTAWVRLSNLDCSAESVDIFASDLAAERPAKSTGLWTIPFAAIPLAAAVGAAVMFLAQRQRRQGPGSHPLLATDGYSLSE